MEGISRELQAINKTLSSLEIQNKTLNQRIFTLESQMEKKEELLSRRLDEMFDTISKRVDEKQSRHKGHLNSDFEDDSLPCASTGTEQNDISLTVLSTEVPEGKNKYCFR